MDYTNRSLACILAGACGDALGYPVEHKQWEQIKSIYGEGGIRTMKVEDGVARITDDPDDHLYRTRPDSRAKKEMQYGRHREGGAHVLPAMVQFVAALR